MGDGTRLATDIYLPRRPRRVPTVVARTPYGTRENAVWFGGIGRLFADNGFAFVAQDTRGHHGSDGIAVPFANEAQDGYDTCAWVIEQPWSDGAIATFGESYVGYTAVATASSGHPAIRAAALRATTTDIEHDWLRHQGVLRLEFVVRWALEAWSGRDNPAPELDWTIRPLRAIVPAVTPDRVPDVLDSWVRGAGRVGLSGGTSQWPALIRQLRVPTHFTAGWWDLFQRGQLRDWAVHAGRGVPGSRLVVEATDHAGHDWGDGPTPDPLWDFDKLAATMPDVLHGELAFLRRQLQGHAGGPPHIPVTWALTHVGSQTATSWPPANAAPLRLHLVDAGRAHRGPEGGSLSLQPDRIPVEARWVHDPKHLVPSRDGESVEGWFTRPDEQIAQVRDDVITFTSDAARVPLDLAGPVTAELELRASIAGGHVMVKLCDVYPTGEAYRMADGASRLQADESAMTVVDLGQTGYRLRAGHRLRLEIASSAFPRYIWFPGSVTDPWDAIRTRPVESRLRSGQGASSVTITVLGDAATAFGTGHLPPVTDRD